MLAHTHTHSTHIPPSTASPTASKRQITCPAKQAQIPICMISWISVLLVNFQLNTITKTVFRFDL
jgi:hypothetical protein